MLIARIVEAGGSVATYGYDVYEQVSVQPDSI